MNIFEASKLLVEKDCGHIYRESEPKSKYFLNECNRLEETHNGLVANGIESRVAHLFADKLLATDWCYSKFSVNF